MASGTKRWLIIGAGIVVVALVAVFAVQFFTGAPGASPTAAGSSASPSTTPDPSASAAPSPGAPSPEPATSAAPAPSASQAPPSAAPKPGDAQSVLAAMSLEQKVGQVLMVSSPVTGATPDSLYALDTLYVGNFFMKGRSTAGKSAIAGEVAAVSGHVTGSRTAGALPFVATDQEGGFVQIMQGPGFDTMPQAVEQGELPVDQLLAEATEWGRQLAAVGVNVNLAPVLDTVPSEAFAPKNAPIGYFGREFGFTPENVSSHGLAFAQGMAAAGVEATAKHFPGLGRVTANTDTDSGVTDAATVRNDPYLAPFQDAVDAGVPWLMISNAVYTKIDPDNMAPFSPVIVTDMVRGDLGFKGIIVSDDICDAVQVSSVPVAERGVDFIVAGGTMALCTNETLLPAMYNGIVAAAQGDPAFAGRVDAAALLVLQAKAAKGLLG